MLRGLLSNLEILTAMDATTVDVAKQEVLVTEELVLQVGNLLELKNWFVQNQKLIARFVRINSQKKKAVPKDAPVQIVSTVKELQSKWENPTVMAAITACVWEMEELVQGWPAQAGSHQY